MSTGISPKEIRTQAREVIEEKEKERLKGQQLKNKIKVTMLQFKCHLYIQKLEKRSKQLIRN